MFVEVGQCDKALETLKKIPAPEFAGWQENKPELIPQELRGRVEGQIRDYAAAQYGIARALRLCKKLKEAEDMLHAIIGTPDKPGWGSGRLYFRKELALVHEEKAAGIASAREANPEWGKALKEWTTLFNIQKARLQKPPPGATPQQMVDFRNSFADAFLDVNRCLLAANQQLLKGQPPEKLQKTYNDIGKRLAEMEKQIPAAEWKPEVQHRYAELLGDTPPLSAAYKAAGGKFFLEKIPLRQ
jgi:tetratricopeptide (TPR) repeat protein